MNEWRMKTNSVEGIFDKLLIQKNIWNKRKSDQKKEKQEKKYVKKQNGKLKEKNTIWFVTVIKWTNRNIIV